MAAALEPFPGADPPCAARAGHVVQFYEAEDRLAVAVAAFLAQGLRGGEAVALVATPAHRAGFLAELESLGVDTRVASRCGQLVTLDAAATLARFMDDAGPDAAAFDREIGGLVGGLAESPFGPRVRVYGEMVAVLCEQGRYAAAARLEELWNGLLDQRHFRLFCAYPMGLFDSHDKEAAFRDVCARHGGGVLPVEQGAAGTEPSREYVAQLQQRSLALEYEVAARRQTEARLRLLAEASAVLSSSLDYERTLENVTRLALPALGDFGFFDLVEQDGAVRRFARAHEDPRRQAILAQTSWVRSERTDMNLCALSSGAPALHSDIDDAWLTRVAAGPEHLAVLRDLAFRSMISVPLRLRDQLMGALTLFHADSGRHHTQADLELAEELARRAAAAVDNARLYREREEANRRKDEFLAMLGHELRNPLAPIRSASQVLRMVAPDNDRVAGTAAVIERQVEHLSRLVDDLLDVSRITRGAVRIERKTLDVKALLMRAVEMAQPLIEARGHRLNLQLPTSRLRVDGDLTRLSQAVGNVLNNAAKFTPAGGDIVVSAGVAGGEVEIRVRDTGIGLSAEMLPRVFELFAQAERSLDRSEGGLGIGLTLAKRLVELHGGTIVAASEGAGRGSEFILRLPFSTGGERPAAEAVESRGGSARKVLVVDDNTDSADMLAMMLTLAGHDMSVSYSASDALARVDGLRPDVVVLDIGLPGMNGYSLVRELRARPGLAAITMIALTGYGSPDDRTRALEAGFDLHLVKPVDPADLDRRIRGGAALR